MANQFGSSRGDGEAIVGMALEKDEARRYASASDLARDIRNLLNDLPIRARPTTSWYQLRKFTRQPPGGVHRRRRDFACLAAVSFLARVDRL